MIDPTRNRALLGAAHLLALAQAFRRHRNPRRRASGRHEAAFYERVWREAAAQLGGTCRTLGGGIAEIEVEGACTRVMENTCALDDPVTLAILADKPLTARLLAERGLAVARHAPFRLDDMGPARRFLDARGGECVVKPARGTGGGRGVATGIETRWQLARAAAAAAVYGDDLMIEEQVEGENYRLLYLDGRLIDAFTRRPPSVVGDGRATVARLIRALNDERLRHGSGLSQVQLTLDLDLRRTLAKQGLSLGSVPAAGRVARLKTVVNENSGADNETATGRLCESIVADGADAVRALGVRLAGIDIITRDPSVPLAESGGVILEVNAPPGFYYHYHKQDAVFPVAVAVLERLVRDRTRGREPASPRPESSAERALHP